MNGHFKKCQKIIDKKPMKMAFRDEEFKKFKAYVSTKIFFLLFHTTYTNGIFTKKAFWEGSFWCTSYCGFQTEKEIKLSPMATALRQPSRCTMGGGQKKK